MEKKDRRLHINMKDEEYDKIRRAAEGLGLRVGPYILSTVLRQIKKEKANG